MFAKLVLVFVVQYLCVVSSSLGLEERDGCFVFSRCVTVVERKYRDILPHHLEVEVPGHRESFLMRLGELLPTMVSNIRWAPWSLSETILTCPSLDNRAWVAGYTGKYSTTSL